MLHRVEIEESIGQAFRARVAYHFGSLDNDLALAATEEARASAVARFGKSVETCLKAKAAALRVVEKFAE